MKELIEGVYNFFTANQTHSFYTGIGGRLHHRQAPQGETFPYSIFRVISGSPMYYFSSDPLLEIREVQFDLFSESPTTEEVTTLENYLEDRFDDAAITVVGFSVIKFERVLNIAKDPLEPEVEPLQNITVSYEAVMEKTN